MAGAVVELPRSDIDFAAHGVELERQELLKAHFFDKGRAQSHTIPNVDEVERNFVGAGAIEPPYNPFTLATLFEHSSALRQNVDSYVTNIEAFGHRFEPVIDLEAQDADEKVRRYIYERRLRAHPKEVEDPDEQVELPSDEAVARCKKEIRERMAVEREKLANFFDFCCLDISFVTLRRRTRQDLETLGNAYWEVIRDDAGRVVQFEYVPSFTVRHMPQSPSIATKFTVKRDDFEYEDIDVRRPYRCFVQVFEQRIVFFKEFGDPRIISMNSGRTFGTVQELLRADPSDRPATEMFHFKIHTSKSSYGIPRWIGTLLCVLGSRQAEEVNYTYFENKSIPPMAILVSGGRISGSTVERIQDYINNDIKGKRNFHKVLVLEAETPSTGALDNSGRMKIELKPLTGAQHNDALFQGYDERNIDKVGQSFRLPRLLRGDIRDFNRATAEASLEFAETQVFGPERDEFDFVINRKLFTELRVRFWKFRSLAPSTRSPKDLIDMAEKMLDQGALTPAEGREISATAFNREFRKLNDPWTTQPLQLTLAGVAPTSAAPSTTAAASSTITPGQGAAGPTAGLGAEAAASAAPPAAGAHSAQQGIGVTGTDQATCFSVNEVRDAAGKGPLMRKNPASGAMEEDPDGWLTVAEFRAKRVSRGEAVGEAQGEAITGTPKDPKQAMLQLAHSLVETRKVIAEVEAQEQRATWDAARADAAVQGVGE